MLFVSDKAWATVKLAAAADTFNTALLTVTDGLAPGEAEPENTNAPPVTVVAPV